jgi:hypothetical protein
MPYSKTLLSLVTSAELIGRPLRSHFLWPYLPSSKISVSPVTSVDLALPHLRGRPAGSAVLKNYIYEKAPVNNKRARFWLRAQTLVIK